MWITKKAIYTIVAIVGILSVIGVGIGCVTVVSSESDLGTIVIDAGHGGIDGGVSFGDIKESNINLETAIMLKVELEKRHYNVVMTRTTDIQLDTTKKGDMQKRKQIIEEARPLMVVSLHVNKWRTANRRGAQVFYDDTKNNQELAIQMQSILNTHVNTKYSKRANLESLAGDYFMTKCSEYPSIIVEMGFISNDEDRRLLMTKEYRQDIVSAVANCIVGNTMFSA